MRMRASRQTDRLDKIRVASRSPRGKMSGIMPAPICPKCRRVIPSDDINVAKDVAYCRDCNISYRLSDLTYDNDVRAGVNLNDPPQGAWYRSDGGGTVIGATNRSVGAAFVMLFFALFWNGITSVFVTFALASTLHLLHVPLPAWFPAPKMNNNNMGPGETLFLWLFLTPFITVGLFVLAACLSSLFGKTEAKIENRQGKLFTGIGSLGWKRTFDPSEVHDVRISQSRNNQGKDTFVIVIETREGKQFKIGSLLTNERQQFVAGALRRTLVR
jgi:hypothetical protein